MTLAIEFHVLSFLPQRCSASCARVSGKSDCKGTAVRDTSRILKGLLKSEKMRYWFRTAVFRVQTLSFGRRTEKQQRAHSEDHRSERVQLCSLTTYNLESVHQNLKSHRVQSGFCLKLYNWIPLKSAGAACNDARWSSEHKDPDQTLTR
jgi:hypothetical protein